MRIKNSNLIITLGFILTIIILFFPFGQNPSTNSYNYFFQEIQKVESFWKILVIGTSLCTPLIVSIEMTQKEKLHFENIPQKVFALFQIKLFLIGVILVIGELVFGNLSKVHGRLTINFLIYFLSVVVGIGWTVGQLFKNNKWWED